METFGEKENTINAYIFMKTVWHILSAKTIHFEGLFLKKNNGQITCDPKQN